MKNIKPYKFILLFVFVSTIIFSCRNTNSSDCNGTIKGYIVYPGEGIPSNLVICAIDTATKKVYQDSVKIYSDTDSLFHFKLMLPKGIYYVCAETMDFADILNNPVKTQGFYTEYTSKKMYLKSGGASHEPIPIKLDCGAVIDNIVVGDFWK